MMAKPATSQRWAWWRPRHAAPAGDDAADFGTTFGLEMSLGETTLAPLERRAQPRRAWWRRLLRRRVPA